MAVFSVKKKGYTLKLTLEETRASASNNTSTVEYTLEMSASAGWGFGNYGLGAEIKFDGVSVTRIDRYLDGYRAYVYPEQPLEILTGSKVVDRDPKSSRTIAVTFSIDVADDDYAPGPMSGTGSFELKCLLDVNYNVDGDWYYIGYADAGSFDLTVNNEIVKVGASDAEYYASEGDSYSITANAKDGYLFTGAISGGSTYQGLSGVYPDHDFGVGLQFRSAKTITYDANGGTGAPRSQTAYWDWKTTISDVKPTRIRYAFLGWSTDPNATAATYLPGSDIKVEEDTTLYAVWRVEGLIRIQSDGAIRECVPCVYHDGEWRQTVPYVSVNEKFKLGG